MNLGNSKTYWLLSRTFTACALCALLLAAGATARAQCPADTLTAGLAGPLDITLTPLGNLLVAETGTPAPNTGRVSIVDRAGNRRTLLDGLPSGFNAIGDLSGTNGLLLRGRTLYVVNAASRVSQLRLSRTQRSARVVREITNPGFRPPTTVAIAGRRLLVVNSQFDRRSAGLPPVLPFTVSSVRRPT